MIVLCLLYVLVLKPALREEPYLEALKATWQESGMRLGVSIGVVLLHTSSFVYETAATRTVTTLETSTTSTHNSPGLTKIRSVIQAGLKAGKTIPT